MPAPNDHATTSPDPVTTSPAPAKPGGSKSVEKQYEFNPHENKIISQLASKMHFVGLFLLAVGLVMIAIGVIVVFHAGPIMTGALACVVGLWTQRASTSLRSVVQTEGRDITHLMDALDDLRKLYSLQYWLLILGVALSLALLWAVSKGYIVL
jgi:hypothetical protein